MKCINYAVKGGGFLTCSFRDNEFGDFLLYKKQKCTAAQLSVKSAVPQCGLQLGLDRTILPESVWVLGPDMIIDTKGNLVDPKGSNFVWLSDIHPHSSGPSAAIPIAHPLDTSPFLCLVDALCTIMRHNIYPALITLGASVMILHYSQIVCRRGHCHAPMNVSASQTGKTTALQCTLPLFGCHHHNFYSRRHTYKSVVR